MLLGASTMCSPRLLGPLALAILLALVQLACANSVLLVDTKSGEYLHGGDGVVDLSASGLSSLMSALSGLLPPGDVDNAVVGQPRGGRQAL